MAEQRLDRADVGSALKEVSGEAAASRMTCGAIGNVRLSDGGGEVPLHRMFMEVVAGVFSGARVWAEFGGGEDELPGPFTRGVGVFPGKGGVHVDLADAGDEVLAMFISIGLEMGVEPRLQTFRQGHEAVFPAFGVVDGNCSVAEVDVFDTES